VLYSPGFEFGLSDTNTFMIHDLVSHGYVVAAVDHPYVSLAVRLDGGRIARFGDERHVVAMPEDASAPDDIYGFPVVVDDLRFTLDVLAQLRLRDPRFAGSFSLDQVGAFGHSYGGAAAAELARSDPRVRAAIDYDGRFHGDVLRDGVSAPLLLVAVPGRITSAEPPNGNYGYRDVVHAAAAGQWVEVAGSVHGSFQADVPWLLARAGEPSGEALDPVRALSIFTSLNLAFFAGTLGDGEPLAPEQVVSRFPELTAGEAR
jgi:pimeloyl-ACP methyl ester carboxylesterase